MLKKLLEGREEEGLLGGGSADVATRCAACAASRLLALHACSATARHAHAPLCPWLLLALEPCRLLERGRKYQEKLVAAQRQAAEAPRDAATGRPLFQPKTHRAPQYERNPEGKCHKGSREWAGRELSGRPRGLSGLPA